MEAERERVRMREARRKRFMIAGGSSLGNEVEVGGVALGAFRA